MILTTPWSGTDARLAFAGVLLNGVILWGLGNLLQIFFAIAGDGGTGTGAG
jgi:hypothetical protein